MKIQIEIPQEYEKDFEDDSFFDFFSRVMCDINDSSVLCGNYEKEVANMFIKAFEYAKEVE